MAKYVEFADLLDFATSRRNFVRGSVAAGGGSARHCEPLWKLRRYAGHYNSNRPKFTVCVKTRSSGGAEQARQERI